MTAQNDMLSVNSLGMNFSVQFREDKNNVYRFISNHPYTLALGEIIIGISLLSLNIYQHIPLACGY